MWVVVMSPGNKKVFKRKLKKSSHDRVFVDVQ